MNHNEIMVNKLGPRDKNIGNGQREHMASHEETIVNVAEALNKRAAKIQDSTIDLAIRSIEARKFLEEHTDAVRSTWLDWMDETQKVLTDIRQTRMAIGLEAGKLLSECADVRKFFLSDDHDKEIAKLREFIELAERLKALKADGTLDKLADTILKLS